MNSKRIVPSFFLFPLFYLAITTHLSAQITLEGKVLDSNSRGIEGLSVLLLSAIDSSLVNYYQTDSDGQYLFSNQHRQAYILQFSHTSYEPFYVPVPYYELESLYLQPVYLKERIRRLDELVVVDESPMKMIGDTLEFNPRSFKIDQHATLESLLVKLPGFNVDANGNITFENKLIDVLTVDGKRFFSDDPRIATRNLPVSSVARIQLYDSKTREAEITGIDSGKRKKRINVKLKKEYKNSLFGHEEIGGGLPRRHKLHATANRFNERHQIGVIGMSNNLNIQGLNQQSYKDFTGRSESFLNELSFYYPQTIPRQLLSIPIDYFLDIGGSEGQTETQAFGINYNYQYLKNKIYTTVFYNQNRKRLVSKQKSDNFLNDRHFSTLTDQENTIKNNDVKILLRLDRDITQKDKLVIESGMQFTKLNISYDLITQQNYEGALRIKNTIENISNEYKERYDLTTIYSHQFTKAFRALSLSQSIEYYNISEPRYQKSRIASDINNETNFRQISSIKQPLKWQTSVSWMEPLITPLKWQPFFNYATVSDKLTRTTDDLIDRNYRRIDTLSYLYDYHIKLQRSGSTFHLETDAFGDLEAKWTVAYQFLQQYARLHSSEYEVTRRFNHWIQQISVDWKLGKLMLIASYHNKIDPLDVNQVVPVILNDQPLYITASNPNLHAEKQRQLSSTLYFLNSGFDQRFEVSVQHTFFPTRNVETRSIDSTFITTTQFRSMGGSQNTFASLSYHTIFGIKNKDKQNRFKPRHSIRYSYSSLSMPSQINDTPVMASTQGHEGNLEFSYQIDPSYYIYASLAYSINRFRSNQAFPANDVRKALVKLRSRIEVSPTVSFLIDGFYRSQKNLTLGYHQEEPVIDVILSKKIRSLDGAAISLGVYDVLNRRSNTQYHSYATGSISQFQTNTIQRYVLLNFVYNFRKK